MSESCAAAVQSAPIDFIGARSKAFGDLEGSINDLVYRQKAIRIVMEQVAGVLWPPALKEPLEALQLLLNDQEDQLSKAIGGYYAAPGAWK